MNPHQEDDRIFREKRDAMLKDQLIPRGIKNPLVLEAMRSIPRHLFLPTRYAKEAYMDGPVPIGFGQTISQPFIVAIMSQLLEPDPHARVLEIGTGCGYQTAVLARLFAEVLSIEIVPELHERAKSQLADLSNVTLVCADGSQDLGLGKFDRILSAASPRKIPIALLRLLNEGGILVSPEGEKNQVLMRYQLIDGNLTQKEIFPVRFVPMIYDR